MDTSLVTLRRAELWVASDAVNRQLRFSFIPKTSPIRKTNFEVLIVRSLLKYHHRSISLLQRKTVGQLTANKADLLRNIFGSAITLKPLDIAISMFLAYIFEVT
jgi:hypothetical protein